MARIPKEDLELLYGKMIAEKELTILGFKNKLQFEIYDGFVNKSSEMQDEIRRYMKLEEKDDITIYEIMQTFNEMARDGVRIEFDKKTKHYKEKCMWK